MKYKPVYIEENVNVSKESPLGKAFSLLGILIGISIITYILLGFVAESIITTLPPKTEQQIGKVLWNPPAKPAMPEEEARLQSILDSLAVQLPAHEQKYKVYLIKQDTFNAFAAPGGRIGVYEGLYKEAESEEEIAFVLAHELAHLVYKDPLKALSRKFLISIISQTLFGNDDLIQSMINSSINPLDLKFSRSTELRADLFAARLIYKKYGSVSGAISFMDRIESREKVKLPQFVYYFSTHPASEDRKRAIEQWAEKLK